MYDKKRSTCAWWACDVMNGTFASSETQRQIVGARESLNGRINMARRKVKNGEKSPWGQCLTRPVPNGHRRSGFWLVPENLCFSGTNQKPERRRPFGTGLVRHCPQGLFSPFFTFLRAIFSRPFRLSLAPTICPGVSDDRTFVDAREYIVLSYSGLCHCSLFFLVLWTSIYRYLVQKLIQMSNVMWQKNRDMIVASRSICAFIGHNFRVY